MPSLFQPTFRDRLRLFFGIIVIVPMIAVGVVMYVLLAKSTGKQADAQLAEAQRVTRGVLVQAQQRARDAATVLAGDQRLATAIQRRDAARIRARLAALVARARVEAVTLDVNGMRRFTAGAPTGIAASRSPLLAPGERPVGWLTVSVLDPDRFAHDTDALVGVRVLVAQGSRVLGTTIHGVAPSQLPAAPGSVEAAGRRLRVASVPTTSIDRRSTRVWVLAKDTASSTRTALIVLAVVLGFLVLAVAFALTVLRTLQAEVQRLLVAAQRIGRGDFAVTVPSEGPDEFAALGREFNNMARQLEGRLEELQRERTRLQGAIRRVGESFATALDREGLLEVVVQTAVDGVGGDAGRAMMRRSMGGPLMEVARAGDGGRHERALHAAEAAVMDAGQVAEIQVGGASALAAPLGGTEDGDRGVAGVVSVARGDRSFTAGERELFAYLTNQASVSVENQDLHETVQRQAVTDELTGLFNHRRFQEVVAAEVERARRYDQEMGLIMLDIDNFKRVNDTYGHMQGDLVLREVARVLRQSSREIDEPARYGGEEMAVALPQTDLHGAFLFAERVRRRIEALELPLVDGDGVLRVTASFGAASLRHHADDKDSLVAAADAALYRAKRSGKNRTVKAE